MFTPFWSNFNCKPRCVCVPYRWPANRSYYCSLAMVSIPTTWHLLQQQIAHKNPPTHTRTTLLEDERRNSPRCEKICCPNFTHRYILVLCKARTQAVQGGGEGRASRILHIPASKALEATLRYGYWVAGQVKQNRSTLERQPMETAEHIEQHGLSFVRGRSRG